MAVDIRNNDRRRYISDLQVQAREKEIEPGLVKIIKQDEADKLPPECDKRMRREIANSNERRRMQCINAGFSALRALIPQLEGEKLSKAAILQHTTDYIDAQNKEKARLQLQVDQLRNLLQGSGGRDPQVGGAPSQASPTPSKRKKRDTESSDEGVGSLSDGSDEGGTGDSLKAENKVLRQRLEAAQRYTGGLEGRLRVLEAQLAGIVAHHPHLLTDLANFQPVKVEAVNPALTSGSNLDPLMYSSEVVEVIAARDTQTPTTHAPPCPTPAFTSIPRPLSPTPERGMSGLEQATTPPMDVGAVTFTSGLTRPPPPAPSPLRVQSAMMMTPPQEMNTSSMPLSLSSAVSFKQDVAMIKADSLLQEPAVAVTLTSVAPTTPHLHNYAHRDHPRRRHRQQAQLEQKRLEEELLRRHFEELKQKEQQQHLQPININTNLNNSNSINNQVFRPHKSSAQNLEILSEAIRQIEGDNVCQLESERFFDMYTSKREAIPAAEESERENSGISDMEEHVGGGNIDSRRLSFSTFSVVNQERERDNSSPVNVSQARILSQTVQQPPQSSSTSITSTRLQPVIITSVPSLTSSPMVSPTGTTGSGSSMSDKYPNVATHLLSSHPIHSFYNRPGVIVSKHQ